MRIASSPFRKIQLWLTLSCAHIALLASVAPARAGTELRELYRGARAQAMGGAFVAVADDEEAIFYNPAGLAGIERFKMNLLIEDAEVSSDSILNMSNNLKAFSGFTPQKINTLMGQNVYLRSQLTPGFVMPSFGFSVIVDDQAALRMQNQALPQITLGYQMTNGVQFATGFSVLGKARRAKSDFRVGIAGKMLWRRGGYHLLSLEDLININQDLIGDLTGSYERGMGVDLGLQFVRYERKELTWSLGTAFQNIGDIQFGPKGDPLKGNLAIGAAVTYRAKITRTTLAYDVRHLLEDADFRKKSHLGIEFGLPIISFYGGLNQTSLVYGASVDLWYLKLTALSYGEDQATFAGQNTERRYMIRLGAQFKL